MNWKNYSISEIELYLEGISVNEDVISGLFEDSRKGVHQLAIKYQRLLAKEQALKEKYYLLNKKEEFLRKSGFNLIAGIDEAGRGPLAGPVVAAAVILNNGEKIIGLDDSKKLSTEDREKLFNIIQQKALAVSVGIINNQLIDKINILQATFSAMKKAISGLNPLPDYLLVDGNRKIPDLPIIQEAVIDGDSKVNAIAAASIIAKVSRDRMIDSIDQEYPQYGFIRNKGYGTKEHIMALKKYGPCPLHRLTFSVVNKYNFVHCKNNIKKAANKGELKELGLLIAERGIFSEENLNELRELYQKKYNNIANT